MSNPYRPTIISPNGGESYYAGENVTISWTMPSPDSGDGRQVSVEVYYCENYDQSKEPEWRQIAVVPDQARSFVWRVKDYVHSDKVRVAVRSRNPRGERSAFSVSADAFSINHRKLKMPALVSPAPGSRHDKYIEIVPDDRALAGSYSQRSLYQFFYSSVKAGTPLTPIAQNVPVGAKSVVWNTIDLTPADDYILHAYVQDDNGNTSDSLLVDGLQLAHEGFFVIDTTPPVASITVNGGQEFTRFQDVTVSIVSYDETTGVQSMQIVEGQNAALPEPVASERSFRLSDGDGTKTVELLLQDFGANRNDQSIQRLFDTVIKEVGLNVVDVAIDGGKLWAITLYTPDNAGTFNLGRFGDGNSLYVVDDYPQKLYTFSEPPTAVCVYNSLTYVGTVSTYNYGTLYRYTGALSADKIITFPEPDSEINCMIAYATKMYLGFENGCVYAYDGAVLVKVTQMPNPIRSLMTDGSSLYLAQENDSGVYIFNGSTFVLTGE